MYRVVLDANQFVSAFLKPRGHPAQIVQAWRDKRIELVVSAAILEEVERVLLYPRLQKIHKASAEEVHTFLREFAEVAVIVPGRVTVKGIARDPDDDKYLACAVEGGADYLISGDADLKDLKDYQGVRIIPPRVLLDLLHASP